MFFPRSLAESLHNYKTKETRFNRIRFVPQEELSVFDNKGQVMLERPNKLALEDTGIGGMLKHVYSSTILDNLKQSGIEYVIIQPLTNTKAKLMDSVLLGHCAIGKFSAMTKIYKNIQVKPYTAKSIHFNNNTDPYFFDSECILSMRLLCDEKLLARFNISEMLRTDTVHKEVIDINSGGIEVNEVKALKLMIKDFLGCGEGVGALLYPGEEYQELDYESRLRRL